MHLHFKTTNTFLKIDVHFSLPKQDDDYRNSNTVMCTNPTLCADRTQGFVSVWDRNSPSHLHPDVVRRHMERWGDVREVRPLPSGSTIVEYYDVC